MRGSWMFSFSKPCHTHTTASFLVRHDDLGWLCYFCDVAVSPDALQLTPRDSYRRRVFVAPLGLLASSDAGVLERVVCQLDASGAVAQLVENGADPLS